MADAPLIVNDQDVAAAAAAAPLYRANLDADGVFWGVTEIHPEDVIATDVVLDRIPDNPPGKYRWDKTLRAMQPLPPSQQKQANTAPDLERTFDALCEWLSAGGSVALPALVAEWRTWYRKSVDQKKIVD